MIALKTKKLDANARLCLAVQKHQLIYDRSHVNYSNREAFDEAWLNVSRNCEESVSSCKSRWRQIRRNFEASLNEAPTKLKGTQASTNYLHDVLDFLIPHTHIDKKQQPVDDETGIGRRRIRSKPISDVKTKEKAEVKSELDSDVEIIEENDGSIKTLGKKEVKEVNKERKCNGAGLKNEDEDKKETKPTKRPPTSTSKNEKNEKDEKDSESIKAKGENFKESQIKKLSQPVISKPPENTDNTETVNPNITKTNTTPQTPKKNVGAFYISPKNDGTFFIKKKSDEAKVDVERKERCAADGELAAKKELPEKAKKVNTNDDTEDIDEDIPLKQISDRSFRLKRACKRGLNKTMIDEVAENDKEPEIKRSRRCAERLKSMAKPKQELSKSLDMPKLLTKPVKMKEVEESRRKRQSLNTSQQVDGVDVGAQLGAKPAANSTPIVLPTRMQTTPAKSPPKLGLPSKMQTTLSPLSQTPTVVPPRAATSIRVIIGKSTQTDAVTFEPTKVETSVVGVQCDLWKAGTTDDFFSTLRPYLNDMNARQKLHFKKKIFESLMEVFDSDTDFPPRKKAKLTETAVAITPATALIPAQLKDAVSGEELSLVRELVAMVQAAKQTPELMVNSNNNDNCCNDSPESEDEEKKRTTFSPAITATTAKPPPLLRVTPTNISFQATSVSSAELPPCLQPRVSTVKLIPTSLQPSITTSTTSFATVPSVSALQKRRFIRKLVKVDDLGAGEGDRRRRVYRLLPSNGTTNTNFRNAATSNEVGVGSGDIETMPPNTTNFSLTSNGCAQTVPCSSSTDMTSGGPGLVRLIKPSSSEITSAGSGGLQLIKPSNITNTSSGPGGIQLISPHSTDTTSGGSGLVQRIKPSNITNTSSGSGGIQLISPYSTNTTSGGSGLVQHIKPSNITNTSSGSGGIQLISPRSTDTTSSGSGLVQRMKPSNITNTSSGSGGIQLISPPGTDTTSGGSGLIQRIKPSNIINMSSGAGRLQIFKSNIIKNTLSGSGRIQVISPGEVNNKLGQSTISSLNTTPTTMGSNIGSSLTPETITAPTSSNKDSQSMEVPATTTPKLMNIRRAITMLSSSSSSTTSSSTNTKISTLQEIETPVSTIAWSFPVATVTGPTGARPLVRRYSVCGPLPTSIAALDRTASPKDILSTTANDKLVAGLSKQITVARNSPASQHNNELFKLPNPLRSMNATTTAVPTATTKLTTSRAKPLASPSASNNNASARTMPALVGFNKSDPQTSSSNSNDTNELPKGLSLRSYYSTISSMNSGSGDDANRSPNSLLNVADKSLATDMDTAPADFESIDFSGIIGSDNFEVVTIKNEPIDYD